MKEVIMCGTIIATIILCFVGIIKLFFKNFKEKHPKGFRVTFYLMSLILSIALPIVAQLFILCESLQSINFAILTLTTFAGVFGLYSSYEGTRLKDLVQTIVSKIATLLNKYSDSKLAKVVGKVGIDKLNEIDKQLKEKKAKEEQEKLLAEQNKKVENGNV